MSDRDQLRILCFGNALHGDDGFGPAVSLSLHQLQWPAGVRVVDCATRGLDALAWFEDCAQIVIVDAMVGAMPGRLHELSPDAVPVENLAAGAHGAGVGYLLAAAREMYGEGPRIVVLAMEIESVKSFAPGLSLPVAAGVGLVVERIRSFWAARLNPHLAELNDELTVLREANQALEGELIASAETLEVLLSEQERQQEELLRRSQELLQLHGALDRAISTMTEIFVLLGPDGRVVRVNAQLQHELGYRPGDVIGAFFEDCLAWSGQEALRSFLPQGQAGPRLLDAIRASGGRFEAELNFCPSGAADSRDDARELPYLVRASLMYSQAGKLEGAVVVSTNIAQLKAREKALRENERLLHETNEELREHRDNLAYMIDAQTRDLRLAKEQAEAASRAKSDFLSNMSHEVRTPLNAILGLTDLCRLTETNAQQDQYLSKIRLAADHLLGVINDILDFSRIEAGKMSIEQLTFDLTTLVEEIGDLLIERIEEKGLELTVDLAAEVGREFVGDPLRLKQVIINLLGNAIKFSEKGCLHLACRLATARDGVAELHFSVSDEGIGIAPEEQEKLFSAFSQADSSTTRRFGGSGLGLAISKRFIELMGGRIWVSSTVGAGSTFHFTVRLAEVPEILPLADQLAGRLAGYAGRRVLIAHDNTAIAQALVGQCGQLGLQAEFVSGFAAAELALAEAGSDFLAVVAGGQTAAGRELLTKVRRPAEAPTPARILLVAHSSVDGVSPDICVDAALAKPSNLRRLYSALAVPLALPELPVRTSIVRMLDLQAYTHLRGTDVLVVDDVEMNRDLMADLLSMSGLNVRLASNGKAAIAAIREKRPDVVLMDCQMPVMDGFAATRYLRSQSEFADLPIIALTAGALEHDRSESLAAGMDAHVTKPVVFDKLMQVIERLVRRPLQSEKLAVPEVATAVPEPVMSEPAVFALPPLPGIDVAMGLKIVRNKVDFYRRMLGKYRDTMTEGFGEQLHTLLHDGAIADATRLAHSLKGASRNLGIVGVGDLAAAVESELKEMSVAQEPPSLEALSEELARIRHVLLVLD